MQVTRVAPDWPVPNLMHRRRVVGDRITYELAVSGGFTREKVLEISKKFDTHFPAAH
jgi:hypothetical protein